MEYEIEFLDGTTKNYEGDLSIEGNFVCIDKFCIRKKDIKHIWKKELVTWAWTKPKSRR